LSAGRIRHPAAGGRLLPTAACQILCDESALQIGVKVCELPVEALDVTGIRRILQEFLEHRHEIMERANRLEGGHPGVAKDTPYRSERERCFHEGERHPPMVESSGELTVGSAEVPLHCGRSTVTLQQATYILLLAQSHVERPS